TLGDLAVREAVGSQRRDAILARRERLAPGQQAPVAPRTRAGGDELIVGSIGEDARTDASGLIESRSEGIPCFGTYPGPAQRRAKLEQRPRMLEPPFSRLQHRDGLPEGLDAVRPADHDAERPQR